MSVWNKAGTWEERDVSKWATDRLVEIFQETETKNNNNNDNDSDNSSIQIHQCTKVKVADMEALITFPRGKKRIGYECSLSMQCTVCKKNGEEAQEAVLEVKLPYVCDDVDDHEYEVKCVSGKRSKGESASTKLSTQECWDWGKLIAPVIRGKIACFAEEMMTKEF
eukprot:Nk52_evm22s2496 gene=Nk52_evmTU22s2496